MVFHWPEYEITQIVKLYIFLWSIHPTFHQINLSGDIFLSLLDILLLLEEFDLEQKRISKKAHNDTVFKMAFVWKCSPLCFEGQFHKRMVIIVTSVLFEFLLK